MMIGRWTRRIVAMGRSHKWLRPLTLFGCLDSLAERLWRNGLQDGPPGPGGPQGSAERLTPSSSPPAGNGERGAKHVKREIILGRPTAPHHGWWQRYCPSA